ncbi:MAG: hypothetical protein ACK4N5_17140, partial [Myxococcales bacterium]
EELKTRWAAVLAARTGEVGPLYGIEVLTPEAAVERFGPLPEKLAKWQLKGGMISVANVGGRAWFALWRKAGNGWAAYGVHD